MSFGKAFAFATNSEFYVTPSQTIAALQAASETANVSISAASESVSVPVQGSNLSSILVNSCQKGNPVLQHVHLPINYSEEMKDSDPDFIFGESTCALFISLRFHRENPTYLTKRIGCLNRKNYELSIILCLLDISDEFQVERINEICLSASFTLILAWDNLEMAGYIEKFKTMQKQPATLISERLQNDRDRYYASLGCVKKLNTTDIHSLSKTFQSFASVCQASMEELALLPGFGEKKIKRIWDAFHQPFAPEVNNSNIKFGSNYVKPTTNSSLKE